MMLDYFLFISCFWLICSISTKIMPDSLRSVEGGTFILREQFFQVCLNINLILEDVVPYS